MRTPPLAATMITAEFIIVHLAATLSLSGAAHVVVGKGGELVHKRCSLE